MFTLKKTVLWLDKRFVSFFLLNIIIIIFMAGYYCANSAEDLHISFTKEELSLVRQLEDESGISYESREPGFYIDASYTGKERRIESPELTLGKGIYRVTVGYATSQGDAYSDVSCCTGGNWRRLLSMGISLSTGTDTEAYLIYSSADPLQVVVRSHLSSESQDYILVDSISVQSEKLNPLYYFVATVFFILLADLLAVCWLKWGGDIFRKIIKKFFF